MRRTLQTPAFCLFLLPLFLAQSAMGQGDFSGFSFTIPPQGVKPGTAPADLAPVGGTAGSEGFVQVAGSGFVLGEGGSPVRFWGTNLCFGGCFPPHDVAGRMARRMASLGINCVRFHHMDRAGYPRGIWDAKRWGGFKHDRFHPEALDRLDYLVAQLKKQGIYTNLNLHVSRDYSEQDGFPQPGPGESLPKYGKGLDHFYPRCVEEQKRYARMLLGHRNKYTGNRYAEEPAVAMVEISNEDGLLHEWRNGALDDLPEPYLEELARQWNTWLRQEYSSTDELASAWNRGAVQGSSVNMLEESGVETTLELHQAARAALQESQQDGHTVRTVRVQKASPTGWHVQLRWAPLTVRKGTHYVLRLSLRANRETEINVGCRMHHSPWNSLGLSRSVNVTTDWRDCEFYFTASRNDGPDQRGRGGARISLSNLSKENLQLSVKNARLQRAAVDGLRPGEKLGDVAWILRSSLGSRTEPAGRDMVRFLRDTEVGYWNEMRRYIREELGAQMAITGTAVGFTTPHIAAESADFVDSHAYWQHPRFPGRPWDSRNWIVRNRAMSNSPSGSTIRSLAARRVFGLPYTVSEYNHPAPNYYEAEGFPLIALYGVFQGWNGVFTFNYNNGNRWEEDHFGGFFDISGHPLKMAVQPACSALLRERAIRPPAEASAGTVPPGRRIELLATRGPRGVDAYAGGVDPRAWQEARIGIRTKNENIPERKGKGSEIDWNAEGNRGVVRYRGRGCAGLIGFVAGRSCNAGKLTITPGDTSLDGFSVVLLNAVDGQELGQAGRYLLTAVCRCRNPGMKRTKEGNSVGSNWGRGPTRCEAVPLMISTRGTRGALQVFPLNPDGTRRDGLNPERNGDGLVFQSGAREATLWYELVLGQ